MKHDMRLGSVAFVRRKLLAAVLLASMFYFILP
jgi:hypothetical protein